MLVWPIRRDRAEDDRGQRREDDDLPPGVGRRAQRIEADAGPSRHRGDLGRRGEEGGDRRRRAFVDVGRPHVERHRADLEGEAGEHEDQAEQQADRDCRRGAKAAAMPSNSVVPVKP